MEAEFPVQTIRLNALNGALPVQLSNRRPNFPFFSLSFTTVPPRNELLPQNQARLLHWVIELTNATLPGSAIGLYVMIPATGIFKRKVVEFQAIGSDELKEYGRIQLGDHARCHVIHEEDAERNVKLDVSCEYRGLIVGKKEDFTFVFVGWNNSVRVFSFATVEGVP